MLKPIGVGMDPLVQLRRNAERQRPEKSKEEASGDKSAAEIRTRMRERVALHCDATFCPLSEFRKSFLQDRHLRLE